MVFTALLQIPRNMVHVQCAIVHMVFTMDE
jgi:hypothetical protein